MQSGNHLSSQLKKIGDSFILSSFYDPTTYYLNDSVFDRDDFKKLKKEGYLEVCFENNFRRHYSLSVKGKQVINNA